MKSATEASKYDVQLYSDAAKKILREEKCEHWGSEGIVSSSVGINRMCWKLFLQHCHDTSF